MNDNLGRLSSAINIRRKFALGELILSCVSHLSLHMCWIAKLFHQQQFEVAENSLRLQPQSVCMCVFVQHIFQCFSSVPKDPH